MKKSIILCLLLCATRALCQRDAISQVKLSLQQTRDSLRYADALNRLGMLFYEQNADSTLYYAYKARDISARHRYKRGLADALNNFGVYFDIAGNTQLALRYYNEAHLLYNELLDSSNIVQTNMNIAMVYGIREEHDKAIRHYDDAYRMGNMLMHDSIQALVIYNYLLQYPGRFTPEATQQLIGRAGAIAKRYKDIRLQLALTQLVATHHIQGQQQKAILMLENAVGEGINKGLYYMSLDMLLELGDLYASQKSARATAYYHRALGIASEKSYLSYNTAIAEKLLDYYTVFPDRDSALYYSRSLLSLAHIRDSINRQSGIDYIDYALQERELASATKEARERWWLLLFAGLAITMSAAVILVLWRNARRKKQTQLMLEEQVKRLESATEALEASNSNYARLIKIIAHDLRNPIGAIVTTNAVLLGSGGLGKDEKELSLLIKDASSRSLKLVSELLDTEFGIREEKLQKIKLELVSFIERTLKMTAYRVKEKKQQVFFIHPGELIIMADPGQIGRVVENLVVNAIKFSREGSAIEVRAIEEGDSVVLSVSDKGTGIPLSIQPFVFDPFTPAKRKGTDGEPAFGLGLYISKEIVEAHKGKIWFESEEWKGTTFFIRLPKA